MAHLLQSTNPDAADRVNGGARPLPLVGEVVRFHPRAGEVRQGRQIVPGLVLKVDAENRQLEIVIVHGSDDMITQDRVPEWIEGDRGWSRMPQMPQIINDVMPALLAFMALVMGDFKMPEGETIMSLINNLDERIGAVEDAANEPVPAKVSGTAPVSTKHGAASRAARRRVAAKA